MPRRRDSEEFLSVIAAILGVAPGTFSEDPHYGAFALTVRDMFENGLEPDAAKDDPIRAILGFVGDRWSALLIQLLAPTPLRFSMLQRIIRTILQDDISRQILSVKLHALERDGFVRRRNLGGARPAVEYSLTPTGQEFAVRIKTLVEWGRTVICNVDAARAAYDKKDCK